jgi:predicted phosphodiesterase
MRIQYLSDIHLEHYKIFTGEQLNPRQWIEPDPDADVLVLAGDIGNPQRTAYGLFLQWCAANWPCVVIVAGNHEFYQGYSRNDSNHGTRYSARMEALDLIQTVTRHYPNLHFLDRGSVLIRPGVRIFGCTLWSEIPADMQKYAVQGLNDFCQIPGATFEAYAEWHAKDLAWLAGELRDAKATGDSAIVVTHHLPTYRLIAEQYQDHPLNCCFATDLEALILETEPAAWLCGHSHSANMVTVGKTLLALNPHGYPGERVATRTRKAVLTVALPQEGSWEEELSSSTPRESASSSTPSAEQ